MAFVQVGARTDVGLVRRLNEDSVLVGERIWAVADGMGGHAAGDVASAITTEQLAAIDHPELVPEAVVAALLQANDLILTLSLIHI